MSLPPEHPTDRKFGFTFVAIFGLLGVLILSHHFIEGVVLLGASVVTALIASFKSHWLAMPKAQWMKLADVLHRFISPVVMGLIYVVVFVPVGLIMRLINYDPLHLKLDNEAKSYWIDREQKRFTPESFKDQF